MLVHIRKGVVAVAISFAVGLGGTAWAQQAQAQAQAGAQATPWKDRAEYDLYNSITQQTDPAKRLELLNQWKEKYPDSKLKSARLQLYLNTYQQAGKPDLMMATAKEILTEDPKNLNALYWVCLLTPTLNNTAPDALDFSEKAGKALTGNLDELRPPNLTDEQWTKAKTDVPWEALGHRTLGWVAWKRNNLEEADKELTADLKLNPNDSEAAYWLGTVVLKNPDRQSDALFFFARAAAYDGAGALPPDRRKQIQDYVAKAYNTYHGPDEAGFQHLLATAKTNAFPPADFKVLNKAEMEAHKDAELQKSDPQLAFWVKLKGALQDAGGEQYFEGGMKGALVPPEGEKPFRGYIVRAEPARNPKTLVLAMSDKTTPEATLKLDAPMVGSAEPGTSLEFRGVPTSFTKEPFMVNFDVEKAKITGWPKQAAPAPARKGVRRKK